MILIGIAGAKQSGKSTVANLIDEISKIETVVDAFANPLKLEVFELISGERPLPAMLSQFQDLVNRFCPPPDASNWCEITKIIYVDNRKEALRPLLQAYGTEYRRGQNTNYWINKMAQSMEEAEHDAMRLILGSGVIFVITDVRFEDEAEFVLNRGGLLIRINRGGPSGDPHASERRLDLPDAVEIDNNGSLDDLRLAVRAYLIGLGVEVRWDTGHAERMVEEFNKEADPVECDDSHHSMMNSSRIAQSLPEEYLKAMLGKQQ